LFVNIVPTKEGMVLETTYSTALFSEKTILAWLGGLKELLSAASKDSSRKLASLPLAGESPEFVDALNQTDYALKNSSLVHAFQNTCATFPQNIAIRCGDRALSYLELANRVDALASHLIVNDVVEGGVIGVCCERSENLVIAVLALHSIGAAYVPLDPSFPRDRLLYMYKDASASAILGDSVGRSIFNDAGVDYIDLEIQNVQSVDRFTQAPALKERLAYIMYTSGSTGNPKGVEISCGSMINLLESMLVQPGFESSDVLLAVTTLAFDISILDLFLPLLVGGTVVIAEQECLKDGEALNQLINQHQVNYLQSTPATFRLLMGSSWSDLALKQRSMKVLCCGEPLPEDLAADLLERVSELWNMFGPTETTVYATRKRITNVDDPITIGLPIENTQVYILDDSLVPVPLSVPGELCVSGDNLAFGYHGRPDLTAEKFVQSDSLGKRIYRTGDLAKWGTNGEVVHLGRIDDQVKIRGYRVELGEIEKVILDSNLVERVAVIVKTESTIDSRLIACCKLQHESSFQPSAIKDAIKDKLPSYMIPQYFVLVDEIPLTGSGKVDRKALMKMPLDFVSRSEGIGDMPQTKDEIYLAALWKEVIEIDEVFLDDNFFDIGGHSLLAASVVQRISEDEGVSVPLQALISSTLGQIAEAYLGENAVVVAPGSPSKKSWFSKVFRK